ncbi:3-oxoacyl-ACP reductase [Bacillus wiedmannii]|uniref:acetoacetyl-CoA reductase n=1 Tax=Bacillus wiedmannii TaxID=1890302 RepID=UPI00099388A4|nr:acetoacetyl-CoA reductase [Bacillus wiedmannii]MDR4943940.1 acetoacetyl-CoA reductase [Bacillus wiedmannii]MED3314580.1 acetoacetyl-CoA reductase [Bacillus wiedmannii]OOR28834.1 3-oxoacyl-[acyl-carrier-protein] reductase [Bacillus wiedmannii]PGB70764.1 3-oxoacyl-ACP reductase [Bacillus wiedmannii]PGD71800.1 3-oxoacyl-ACP reductase [Bacillus wiedmannii]
MVQLNGKVAIVTGGAKGIGKAITVALAQEGAKVVINYNSSKEAAENLVNELGKEGHDVYAVQADVSKVEDANRLVEEAVNHFGKVDILVNNAGITRDRTFKKLNREDWERVIDVNLSSVFNITSAVLPYISEAEEGRIISISSIIGQAGGFGQTNYSAAKAGMLGFTKSLALELAKTNVTVNAICPGFIDTEMVAEVPEEVRQKIVAKIPKKRFGQADEIAKGVVYLCRDGAYITGQQLNINGGLYM